MPTLCDAIRLRSGHIFPIYIICECADGHEYSHAWKTISFLTERCVEVVGHDCFPHQERQYAN